MQSRPPTTTTTTEYTLGFSHWGADTIRVSTVSQSAVNKPRCGNTAMIMVSSLPGKYINRTFKVLFWTESCRIMSNTTV